MTSWVVEDYDRINDFGKTELTLRCSVGRAVVAARYGPTVAFFTKESLTQFKHHIPDTMSLWCCDLPTIQLVLKTFPKVSHIGCDVVTAMRLDRRQLESSEIPTLTVVGARAPLWVEYPDVMRTLDPFIAVWYPDQMQTFLSYHPIGVRCFYKNAHVYTRPYAEL